MDGDECIYVGGGVALRAAHNAERAANREARERGTYASAPRTQPRETRLLPVVCVSPARIVVDDSGPNYRPPMTAEQGKKMRAERKHVMTVKDYQQL